MRLMTIVLALSLFATEARAQEERGPPAWTWGVTLTGLALVVGAIGTGSSAWVIQGQLDTVCDASCPANAAVLQEEGRALAITTDILWLGGLVLSSFGLVTLLTVREAEVRADLSIDGTGLRLTGTF